MTIISLPLENCKELQGTVITAGEIVNQELILTTISSTYKLLPADGLSLESTNWTSFDNILFEDIMYVEYGQKKPEIWTLTIRTLHGELCVHYIDIDKW